MTMLNRIILIGRLVRDPELRYTPNGVATCGFSLAVDRAFVNQKGERETDFIDIVIWRKLAETCAAHLGKGRLVAVEGRLQIRSYETAEGQKRKVAEVVADNVRFLDWPDKGREGYAPSSSAPAPDLGGSSDDEDIPF